MKRPSTTTIAVVLGLALLIDCTLAADDATLNTLTAEEQKDGWQLLFDGQTLDGWMSWKTKAPLEEEAWVAKDGVLEMTGKGGGDIYTAGAFVNYEFSIEWKTTGNSGILIRVDPTSKGAIYGVAPEVQIERSKGNSSTSAGGLYALYEIEGEKVIDPDGWNEVRIRLENGHGTHWFNGRKVYEYTIGSDDWNERLAKSKFRNAKGFGLTEKGHIGLQDHGAKVAFRNIKIRDLDAAAKQ